MHEYLVASNMYVHIAFSFSNKYSFRFFIKHSSDVDDLHDLIGECSLSIPYLLGKNKT